MRCQASRIAVLVSLVTCLTLAACISEQLEQPLPDRVLVGYWHNWDSATTVNLQAVPPEYDVVNIAFATPTVPGGATMQFTPDAGIYATRQAFIADVRKLQAQGKKVLISIGGANDPVQVKSAADAASFASSMQQIITTHGFDGLDIDLEGGSLSLDAGDTDFRSPKSPRIVHFIAAVKSLMASLPPGTILTAAPETAFVQGGYSAYAGVRGAYLPVLHALRYQLTYVHVQHYNTGSMFGLDGKIYVSSTPDFHVAMAEMLLHGFKVSGSNAIFPPLRPDQVAIGLPASLSATGSGYTPPGMVQQALDYLCLGKPFGGKYVLARAGGYPGFRGLMTWSINWDLANRREFAGNHGPYLRSVFLRRARVPVNPRDFASNAVAVGIVP